MQKKKKKSHNLTPCVVLPPPLAAVMYRCATGRSDITVVCGYRCASHHTWIHDGDLRVTIQSDDDGELLDTSKLFKQTGFRLFL